MARIVFDNGFLTVTARHLMRKADGSWYYQRRVPKGLEKHHGGKDVLRQSLQTKDGTVAARKAAKLTAEYDALWKHLQSPQAKDLGLTTQETRAGAEALLKTLGLNPGGALAKQLDHHDPMDAYLTERHGEDYLEARYGRRRSDEELEEVLTPIENEAMRRLYAKPGEKRYLLSDARDLYLQDHKNGEKQRFKLDTERAVQHVIDTVGDLPLTLYTRDQARSVLGFLTSQGNKTATARRRLRTINAVINTGIREFDLKGAANPFNGLRIKNEGDDAEEREPFTRQELQTIAKACRDVDDDIRHIIAMQLDTGARAGEVIGLRLEDVFIDHAVPHVWFKPHAALGRTLKTKNSNRKVPLVGEALWAARRALEAAPKGSGWLFPRYAADRDIKADHASATINAWLKRRLGTEKTSHSFRHSMRDRLRDVKAPEEIQNDIGGWGGKTIGQGYGEGNSLQIKQEYLLKVVF
jgi:integrase